MLDTPPTLGDTLFLIFFLFQNNYKISKNDLNDTNTLYQVW